MHGIGIIWHLTIHLSMTPCGLDWLEEEEGRRILKRQTYMHLHTTMSPPSRQLRKYTWVLPVSDMYFQLGRCYTAQEGRLTYAETYRPAGLDRMSYVPPKPQSREPTSRQLHQRCHLAKESLSRSSTLVIELSFGNPNPDGSFLKSTLLASSSRHSPSTRYM